MSVLQRGYRTRAGSPNPSAPEGTRNADLSRARVSLDVWQGYEDCWDLPGTPTSEVKVRLPRKFRELAQGERVGLPPGTRGARHCPNGDTRSVLAIPAIAAG
jgi:hypothetical protein